MEKLKHEYISNGWHPGYAFTVRDSRHAFGFGQRLQMDKPRGWLRDAFLFIGALALVAVIIYFRIK